MNTTCIIPAYNEESTIREAIRIVKRVGSVAEIIVVDDGSSDNTGKCAKMEKGVLVMRHARNKGKGAAIKTGIKESTGDILLFLDGDIMSLDPGKIEMMIQSITKDNNDVAIGYFRPICFQTFTQVAYIPLMQLLFPEVLEIVKKGHLSGQRAFKREIIEKMALQDGFDLEAGMNIHMAFMKPVPKISFINLGTIKLRPKGYQKSMSVIADSILSFAKEYDRLDRMQNSSFSKVACAFCDSLKRRDLL